MLCVPAPYTIRQRVKLPEGCKLRTAFGLSPGSWDKQGAGVRFSVRLRGEGAVVEVLSEEVKRWRGEDSPHWSPVMLDLPTCLGELVEIELVTEPLGEPRPGAPEDFVGAYALWMNPALVAPSDESRPNIILILVDALRADHLGCYGYDRETSPHLDRLAREAVLFEDANAQATWTLPSVQSMLTSSYRFVRGIRPRRGSAAPGAGAVSLSSVQPVTMPVSLQGELRRAGYTALAVVGGGFLDPALGFDAGFDAYWSPQHAPMLPDQLATAIRRLAAIPSRPFFLFLHTYEVHNYFQGWAHSLERFDSGYLGPLTDPRRLGEAALNGRPEELSPADLQYIHDLYDGEIRHLDRYLHLFLEWLSSQPWGENTIVVVTSDHGEALGDHGAMSHGGVPYRGVMRVPLLIRLPRGGRAGLRVAEPVALADLMPTLLELAGAAAPAGLTGRSLVPLLDGEEEGEPRPIFCESRGAAVGVRHGAWSYVGWRGTQEEELYDLASDPGETRNLAEADPEQLGAMRRTLAGLAMEAARGYRLVVAGPRAESVTVELESDSALSYLDIPTMRDGGVSRIRGEDAEPSGEAAAAPSEEAKHHLVVAVGAGGDPHVILLEPDDPKGTVSISARMGRGSAQPARYHLGGKGAEAGRTPVVAGPATRPLLTAEQPPVPERPETWGIWIWVPPRAIPSRARPRVPAEELPEGLLEQLGALGYLR